MTVAAWFRIGSLLPMAAALLIAGCEKRQEAIRVYDAPKDPPPVAQADAGPAPIQWTLPDGWKQIPDPTRMRYATIQVSAADPKAVLTVVPLPGEAAELMPNVRRWAGQLKLPSISESDLPKYVTPTQVSGEPGRVVDLTGPKEGSTPPTRLLAAIVPHAGRAWFFTLKAPEPLVADQKAKFEQFIHSIQFPVEATPADSSAASDANGPDSAGSGTQTPSPEAPPASGGASVRLAHWTTPAGWQEQPGANSMRVVSFHVGSGARQAEIIVSRINQTQTGSFLDNINRWRGQVGLEPVTEQKPGDMQPVTVAGHPALMISLTGPASSDGAKELLVSIDIEGPDFWFVKMLGSADVVSAQTAAFRQFLDSMRFEPESR